MVFHIVETNQPGLLGFKASQELGLIKVVMTTKQDLKAEYTKKYVKVFTGLGGLEKPYHIEVDPTVKPVVNPPRISLLPFETESRQTLRIWREEV